MAAAAVLRPAQAKGAILTTEVWLALLSGLASAAAAIWVALKVIIPRIVEERLESRRDQREHRQSMEETEFQSEAQEREANQRLTLTLNHNIIGTLERSMAESTTANEAIRERFFGRLDTGMNHIYSELDGLRLEMRRMEANYSDLARDRHLLEMENYNRLEIQIERLARIIGRLAVVIQATHAVELQLPEELDNEALEGAGD